ncbi:uncharacterized protein LY89DRAFT_736925 [Mollisia scopiformis]|uniref:Uncharacterized protein n=1 Tax=Mollisia scopiformis TaxID=149040 RepID=A0A194X157_MOLSC|nr:uncharacterized protein LY89DRAFT_736925 [Mollisia scopiformis]KUJ13926.1 hypothetical protein LY89DRAFT_736925 [Mollisia scopiformis]
MPSARIQKRAASQRKLNGVGQADPAPQRRSPRLRSKVNAPSVARGLDRLQYPQYPLSAEGRPARLEAVGAVDARSRPRIPVPNTSAATPVSSPEALQGSNSRRIDSRQTRKRKLKAHQENSPEKPIKKARLTERNLRALEKMARTGKSGKSSRQSTSTTTTDKDFGPRLMKNGVVFDDLDVQPPDDVETLKDLLD